MSDLFDSGAQPTVMLKPDDWTSDDWSTPPAYFAEINARFGPFDLDPCARPETAKAAKFFTKADDGLAQPWMGRVFCNPPYSCPRKWCEKAHAETATGRASIVVMLLPAAVDTNWFHDLVLPFADVEFIRGRLRFYGWKGTPIGSPKAGNVLGIYPKGASSSTAERRPYTPAVAGSTPASPIEIPQAVLAPPVAARACVECGAEVEAGLKYRCAECVRKR